MARARKKHKDERTSSSGVIALDGVLIDEDDYPFTDDSSDALSDTPSDHGTTGLQLSTVLRNNDGEREKQFLNEETEEDMRDRLSNRDERPLRVDIGPHSIAGSPHTDVLAARLRISSTKTQDVSEDDERLTRRPGLSASQAAMHLIPSSTSSSGSSIPSSSIARENFVVCKDTDVLQDFPPTPLQRNRSSTKTSRPLRSLSSSKSVIHDNGARNGSEHGRQIADLLFPEASNCTPVPSPSPPLLLTDGQSNTDQRLIARTRATFSSCLHRPLLSTASGTLNNTQNRDFLHDSSDKDYREAQRPHLDIDEGRHANTGSEFIPPVMSSTFDSSSNALLHRASPNSGSSRTREPPTASSSKVVSPRKNSSVKPEPRLLSCYKCPICLSPPINATTTLCGHVACGECLFTAVRSDLQRQQRSFSREPVHPRCPVCRDALKGWDGKGGGVIGLKPMVVIVV